MVHRVENGCDGRHKLSIFLKRVASVSQHQDAKWDTVGPLRRWRGFCPPASSGAQGTSFWKSGCIGSPPVLAHRQMVGCRIPPANLGGGHRARCGRRGRQPVKRDRRHCRDKPGARIRQRSRGSVFPAHSVRAVLTVSFTVPPNAPLSCNSRGRIESPRENDTGRIESHLDTHGNPLSNLQEISPQHSEFWQIQRGKITELTPANRQFDANFTAD